ncbi:hypothetical protein ACJIZ3_001904 [Penstemon smallii]|uniref:NAB domain-containing protein n=1 Tax=Penstemon smallii TaxID=265156 RepID=A0ABD3U6R1_9LAMI
MWCSLCEIQLSFRRKFKTNIRRSNDTNISHTLLVPKKKNSHTLLSSQAYPSALWHYKRLISSQRQGFKSIHDIEYNLLHSDPYKDRQIADKRKKGMPKHRWREPFISFLGSHFDEEKDVELKGTKPEIEGKVQKILELLKEEQDNDGQESVAKLIQDFHNHYQSLYESYDHLTEELRKKAQGKHAKDSSSSSSDSSDSDDSRRKKGTKNGKVENNMKKKSASIKQELDMAMLEVGELNKKLTVTIDEKEALYLEYQSALSKTQEAQRIIMDLNAEAGKWNDEKSRLTESAHKIQAEQYQKLEDMKRERETLILEKEAFIVSIEEEKKHSEELRKINSQLQHEKDTLKLELEAMKGEFSTLMEKLESKEKEIVKLMQMQKTAEEENIIISSKISLLEDDMKQAENNIQDLVTKSSELSEKVAEKERELSSHLEIHEAHKEEASTRMKDLEVKLDTSHTQRTEIEKQKDDEFSALLKRLEDQETDSLTRVNDLTAQIDTIQLDVETLQTDKRELEEQIIIKFNEGNHLREENGDLEKKMSGLEKTLTEREAEVISIQKKLEDVQIEASTQIAALTEQVNSFQQQLELQQLEKSQLEAQISRGKLGSEERFSQVENLNTELVNKFIQEERKLKEKEDAFIKLSEEHKQLGLQYQNLEKSLKSSQKKIEEMTEQLHKDRDTENQELNQLEESIEDLKSDLEMKEDEIITLREIMRNTEVKHRLTSQKLHITEQLLTEKEEIQLSKELKLQKEHKLLEERITRLSGIVTTYKEAQVKMITEVSEKVNHTLTEIDTFNMKFEEDYGHFETRVYEIVNELKLTRNWITETNVEKDQLKMEITSLLQQLKEKEEEEVLMSVKIEEMETILMNDEDEKERLTQTVEKQVEKLRELEKVIEEMDEKMGELERKMNEKDNGLVSLSEEKREAIRQLCVWIDYHRNRYIDLKDMISKKTRGRQQIAT